MRKCIYSTGTGELIAWWNKSLTDIYFEALSKGAKISIIDVLEKIEKQILSGKAEYKVINGKLAKDEN